MELLVASGIGLLFASGTYLLLRGRTFPVIVGLALHAYGVNALIFAMGRLRLDAPPVLSLHLDSYTDPLPQALVLTAIVIAFGMTAFVVVLILRSYLEVGNDHVDGIEPGDEAAAEQGGPK